MSYLSLLFDVHSQKKVTNLFDKRIAETKSHPNLQDLETVNTTSLLQNQLPRSKHLRQQEDICKAKCADSRSYNAQGDVSKEVTRLESLSQTQSLGYKHNKPCFVH